MGRNRPVICVSMAKRGQKLASNLCVYGEEWAETGQLFVSMVKSGQKLASNLCVYGEEWAETGQ